MVRMNNRGFTLIEILVTMLIAGVLLAALLATYQRGLYLWRGQVNAIETRDHLRIGLDRAAREIQAATEIEPGASGGDKIVCRVGNGKRVHYYYRSEGRQLLRRVDGVANSVAEGVDAFAVFYRPDGLVTLRLTGGEKEGDPVSLETSVWVRATGD